MTNNNHNDQVNRGGLRGGGGGGGASAPSPQGFDPLPTQRVQIHFWPTDPKIFLKAPIYTNFEGERNFFVKIFQKGPKTAF